MEEMPHSLQLVVEKFKIHIYLANFLFLSIFFNTLRLLAGLPTFYLHIISKLNFNLFKTFIFIFIVSRPPK